MAGILDSSDDAVGPHHRPWLGWPRDPKIVRASFWATRLPHERFLPVRTEDPCHGRPISSRRTTSKCCASRPELRRENNAPRCFLLRLRAPSTGESERLRRAARPPRPRRLCHRRSRFRHAFTRCAARQARRFRVVPRAPHRLLSIERTTSTPRASATSRGATGQPLLIEWRGPDAKRTCSRQPVHPIRGVMRPFGPITPARRPLAAADLPPTGVVRTPRVASECPARLEGRAEAAVR